MENTVDKNDLDALKPSQQEQATYLISLLDKGIITIEDVKTELNL